MHDAVTSVTIYNITKQGQNNDDIKIKWQKCIGVYGRSWIPCFLVSNILLYSGNMDRGKKEKVWYSTPTKKMR